MRHFTYSVVLILLSLVACDKDSTTPVEPVAAGKVVATMDVPGKPGTPAGTATHASVTISWSASSGDVDEYEVRRRRPGVDPVGTLHVMGKTTGRTFTDNTVAPETEYGYRVWAINSDGYSNRSGIFKITTPAAPAADVPPPTAEFVGPEPEELETAQSNHGGDEDGNTRGSVVRLGDITDQDEVVEIANSITATDFQDNRDIFVFSVSERRRVIFRLIDQDADAQMNLWSGLDEDDDFGNNGAKRIISSKNPNHEDEKIGAT